MPWIDDADVPALRAWAELEIIGAGLFADITARGTLNDEGEPRRAVDDLRRIRQTQLVYSRELGLTPKSRAELSHLASDLNALDLSQHRAEGRRLRLERGS